MSGDILVSSEEMSIAKHDRLVLNFKGGRRMTFNDSRKFGRAWLVSDLEQILGGLGPEPFDPNLSVLDFYEKLQSVNRQIKPLLLDQKFIAGVGNIYADESLHLARIHPLTRSNQLTIEQCRILLNAIRSVLSEGIQRNGASIDRVYRGGDFQNYFRVHMRAGEPCPVCSSEIIKMTVGQRGTYLCTYCQPY
jgi:formamidopyrimidine-DNA glycosylase